MKNTRFIFLTIAIMFMFASCSGDIKLANECAANYVNTFWDGLIHGVLAIPVCIINVFSDTKHAIYATNNNGDWYNIGFILGITSLASSGGRCSSSKKS